MRDIQLVAFDLDGTLFRTETATVPAVKAAFQELGAEREPPDEEIKSFFGELHEVFMDWVMSYGLKCSREEAARRIDELELENVRGHGELYPGAVDTLNGLRDLGCTTAICSNGREKYIRMVMDVFGLWSHFDTVRFRTSPSDSKPGILKRLLDDYEAQPAILVGDRYYDFDAALGAGIPSVGVSFGYGKDELDRADSVIDALPEMLDIVTARERVFERIEREINGRKREAEPFVVGVSGIDNSGKTSFAKGLSAFLGERGFRVQRVHLDHFHHPKEVRRSGEDEIENYLTRTFDFESIAEKILKPAKSGETVRTFLPAYDIDKEAYDDLRLYQVDRDTVLILDGVFLEKPEIRPPIDFQVWLDISFEECLKRARRRDVPRFGEDFLRKYHSKYIPAQRRYIEEYHPKENADLVVDNTLFLRPKILD
jgi:phosphoglycolate phosphatase-like HAD superfamily hydrolase/uridine kinase